jgi:hypothetical protein
MASSQLDLGLGVANLDRGTIKRSVTVVSQSVIQTNTSIQQIAQIVANINNSLANGLVVVEGSAGSLDLVNASLEGNLTVAGDSALGAVQCASLVAADVTADAVSAHSVAADSVQALDVNAAALESAQIAAGQLAADDAVIQELTVARTSALQAVTASTVQAQSLAAASAQIPLIASSSVRAATFTGNLVAQSASAASFVGPFSGSVVSERVQVASLEAASANIASLAIAGQPAGAIGSYSHRGSMLTWRPPGPRYRRLRCPLLGECRLYLRCGHRCQDPRCTPCS